MRGIGGVTCHCQSMFFNRPEPTPDLSSVPLSTLVAEFERRGLEVQPIGTRDSFERREGQLWAEIAHLRRTVDGWVVGWNGAQARWLRAEAELERLGGVLVESAIREFNDN